jgi:hypothetical protein
MAAPRGRSWATLLVITGFAIVGCSKTPTAAPTQKPNIEKGLRKTLPILDRTLALQQLRTLGLAYKLFAGEGRVPKTIDDLEPYYENRKITQAVQDGSYVVFLGVNPDRLPGNTVLAYQAEPDAQGERVVLLCNGSVEAMPAAAFEAAPKARQQ